MSSGIPTCEIPETGRGIVRFEHYHAFGQRVRENAGSLDAALNHLI
jgi:hypothetical protein